MKTKRLIVIIMSLLLLHSNIFCMYSTLLRRTSTTPTTLKTTLQRALSTNSVMPHIKLTTTKSPYTTSTLQPSTKNLLQSKHQQTDWKRHFTTSSQGDQQSWWKRIAGSIFGTSTGIALYNLFKNSKVHAEEATATEQEIMAEYEKFKQMFAPPEDVKKTIENNARKMIHHTGVNRLLKDHDGSPSIFYQKDNLDRILNVARLKNVIQQNNLSTVAVPEAYVYGGRVFTEYIDGAIVTELSLQEVQDLAILAEETGYWDWLLGYSERPNVIRSKKDNKLYLIDTENLSFTGYDKESFKKASHNHKKTKHHYLEDLLAAITKTETVVPTDSIFNTKVTISLETKAWLETRINKRWWESMLLNDATPLPESTKYDPPNINFKLIDKLRLAEKMQDNDSATKKLTQLGMIQYAENRLLWNISPNKDLNFYLQLQKDNDPSYIGSFMYDLLRINLIQITNEDTAIIIPKLHQQELNKVIKQDSAFKERFFNGLQLYKTKLEAEHFFWRERYKPHATIKEQHTKEIEYQTELRVIEALKELVSQSSSTE